MTEEHQTSSDPSDGDGEAQSGHLPAGQGSEFASPLPDPLQFTVMLAQLAAVDATS